MQTTHPYSTSNGSPRLGGGAKSPPMSKYFQTPTPSWKNQGQQQALIQDDSGPSSSSDSIPSLPPRPPPSAPAGNTSYEISHAIRSAQHYQLPQGPASAPLSISSKIPSYKPLQYGPMPSAQNSPMTRLHPQGGAQDTSKWGVKYNHGYTNSQDQRPKPVLPPRPQSATRNELNHPQSPSRTGSQADQGGYKLQAVAYDPNPPDEDFEDPRQSWQEGDDLESMQTSPLTQMQPPPKPPKIPKDERSGALQNLRAAPQLPPLYFESEKVQQQDFAYPQQHSQIPPQAGPSSSYQPSPIPLAIPPYMKRSSASLALSPQLPRSTSENVNHLQSPGEQLLKTSESPNHPPKAQQPVSSPLPLHSQVVRGSPPKPTTAIPPVDAQGRSQVTFGSQTSPTHQNETIRPHNENDSHDRSQGENLPRRNHPTEGAVGDSSSSFYWHSPQSSTSTNLDSSPKALAADDNGALAPTDEIPKITSLSFGALSNASALGFGGPSDWEHFGDYEAEEIDDTDLYISNKPKTAELPATNSPIDTLREQPTEKQAVETTHKAPVEPVVKEEQPSKLFGDNQTDTLHRAFPEQASPIDHQLPSNHEPSPAPEEAAPVPDPFVEIEELARSEGENTSDSASDDEILDDGIQQHAQLVRQPTAIASREELVLLERAGSRKDQQPAHGPDNKANPDVAPKAFQEEEKNEDEQHNSSEQQSVEGQGSEHVTERDAEDEIETKQQIWEREDDKNISSPIMNYQRGSEFSNNDGTGDIIISLQIPESPTDTTGQALRQRDINGPYSAPLLSSSQMEPKNLDSPSDGRPRRLSAFPNSTELEDPYLNLDQWAKASLNRYVKMLHEEAEARTEEMKYMIFMNFTRKETRLRAVLYDVEDESGPLTQELRPHPVNRAPLKGSASLLTLRPSIKFKDLPALPTDAAPGRVANIKDSPLKLETASQSIEKAEGPAEQRMKEKPQSARTPPPLQVSGDVRREPSDESYVLVDDPGKDQQMSKERQLLSGNLRKDSSSPLKVTPSLTSLRQALDLVGNRQGVSSSKGGSSAGLDTSSESTHNRAGSLQQPDSPRLNSIPIGPDNGNNRSGSTEKPAYTPFKYNEGRPYEGDKASNRQSIYQPFSTLLRQGSTRHGSFDNGSEPLPDLPNHRRGISGGISNGSAEHTHPKVLEPGKIENSSQNPEPNAPSNPPNQRLSILEPLLLVIPQTSVLRPESEHVLRVRQKLELVPDDFGFIHETVLAWDQQAKQMQKLHDRERHVRQTESEERIDALFNDNEIVYADIPELEDEFKKSEAARKADEDRAEYDSFVASVFDVVWARLHFEMDQLAPLYDTCVQLVVNATAGKEMFDGHDELVPVAPAMEVLLILYQKLSIRHQKAFEAVLERDRRLKKIEMAPWYTLGDIWKTKKIDKRYDEAEKKAILEFCRQRDERANLLMDVLDQNTLRGVGTNQDYMESVMQAVRKIAMDVALGAVEEDTAMSTDEVLKARTITTALARSSEQIVQTFHVADMLLNSADYEVSVANARLAAADEASFKRLREAKVIEDQKLVKDLEHRMSLIRGDTSRTLDEIAKLLSLIGRSPTDSTTPPGSTSAPADSDKEARLLMALEEAKRRNAQKEGAVIPL